MEVELILGFQMSQAAAANTVMPKEAALTVVSRDEKKLDSSKAKSFREASTKMLTFLL
jgi:hypothetical protein